MTDYDLSAYDFDLPEGLIAQRPAERRDGSRMLVLHRETGEIEDRVFSDIVDYIQPADAVVVNNTRVVRARLVGRRRPGGGKAELFLVRREQLGEWTVLARPGRKLQPGAVVDLANKLVAEVLAIDDDGRRRVRFSRAGDAFASEAEEQGALDAAGEVPLPPYIARKVPDASDDERYQTVYASQRGAVAAPTAGLHFTSGVLEHLHEQGTSLAEVTLHVGYGTFEPVKTEDLRTHSVASEEIEVSADTVRQLEAARQRGGRVLAVGTTSTRALETAAQTGELAPYRGETELTIRPGDSFHAVDALLTNFHLPKSSLLVLVSAFADREQVLAAYRHAVTEQYRFYSYGDCMLIL
ncbi:MAG: tRNA preQ1(34) S-adenosylmethionine ribosyltransferase-isomerase QueA [Bacteroidota bacterium]